MNSFPLDDEDQDLLNEGVPIDTVAGPQTQREKVVDRIRQVRAGSTAEGSTDVGAAQEYAQGQDLAAGLGRIANTLAAGTGAKVDNSAFDLMQRQGHQALDKAQARSAAVKQAILRSRASQAAAAQKQQNWQSEFGANERHRRTMEAIAGQNAGVRLGKNRDIDVLPAEEAEVVKDLAKKNASKIAIANQIDAVMKNWDALSDEQKVTQGGQLLKVLNSTEGADAIGAEEAKRLGSFLEKKMFNIRAPGSMFGRDLPQFKEQALTTAAAIRGAVRSNQLEQNRIYRSHGIARQDPPELPPLETAAAPPQADGLISEANAGVQQTSFTPADLEALQWAKANPSDKRAASILQRLKGKGL